METLQIVCLCIWLAVFVVSLVVEFVTVQLVSVWFAVGAFVTLCLTFIPGFPIWAQCVVFVAVSGLTLGIVKPLADKKLAVKKTASNVDSLVGKNFRLIKQITPEEVGEIKIGDVIWNAISEQAEKSISKDAEVVVVRVEGNKIVVKIKPEEQK